MALACTNIAAASFADTAGGDPVSIPSHTVVADRLYTFAVVSSTTPTVVSVTLPGTGTEVILADRARTTLLVVTVGYMLCTAGGTGTGSIDLSASTTGCCFSLDEWTGIDLTDPVIDTNVAEVDGTDTAAPTDVSLTLPSALTKTTNAIWGAWGFNSNDVVTPGTDYTETFDAGHGAPTRRIQTQYDIAPADLVFDAQMAGSAAQYAGIGFEINEASAGSTIAFDAAIAGTGAITVAAALERAFAATIAGSGAVTADLIRQLALATQIAGDGSLSAALVRDIGLSISVLGEGALSVALRVDPVQLQALITALGVLDVEVLVSRPPTAADSDDPNYRTFLTIRSS